jgi:hypothetical protein
MVGDSWEGLLKTEGKVYRTYLAFISSVYLFTLPGRTINKSA